MSKLLTVAAAAELLDVDIRKVLTLLNSGKLIGVNLSDGKRPSWRISPESLQAFIATRLTQGAVPRVTHRRKAASAVKEFV